MDKFYITTPIYYVNDEPHIGHAYTTILADVLAGYHRLLGRRVYFLTGTDEHGQKLQDTAAEKGFQPQVYCDKIVERFLRTWEKLGIKNDDFIRTTQDRHKNVVTAVLQRLYTQTGDDGRPLIYAADYQGWYCKYEERFWTEKDLVDGNCPDCGRAVQRLSERNYFFRLSHYQEWLVDYIKSHPGFIQPEFRRNEVLGFLRQPLGDLCISRPRSRLSWGIPLPFDPDYVCYVWFDALLNYISAIGYDVEKGTFATDWWPAVHLIGKDILTTHAVYWPCMLKALGLEMPTTIFATGWWLWHGAKMSKSLGNVVGPLQLADKYGIDAFRFFLVREMTLGQDAVFSEEAFAGRYNSELANDLGNLLSRIVKMIQDYCNGIVPRPDETGLDESQPVVEKCRALFNNIPDDIDQFKLNTVLDRIFDYVRFLNRYVEHARPWDKAIDKNQKELNLILYHAAEGLFNTAIWLSPVMPQKSRQIATGLGQQWPQPPVTKLKPWGNLTCGVPIGPKESLFPRLKQPPKTVQSTKEPTMNASPKISIDEFKKIELRVAEVIAAENVTGADKLLKLQIQIGGERRQIIAGIAKHYRPEELVGRKIIVVTNLQPTKIRGIDSDGMLLAATSGDRIVILVPDKDIDSGAVVS